MSDTVKFDCPLSDYSVVRRSQQHSLFPETLYTRRGQCGLLYFTSVSDLTRSRAMLVPGSQIDTWHYEGVLEHEVGSRVEGVGEQPHQ